MSLRQAFQKTLTANDVGATTTHQAGIHVPKTEQALLDFLPPLDPRQRNPDAWIKCVDELGGIHRFRYIYYNNKLHAENGTRNEYRISHMTGYLRQAGAKEGDLIEISKEPSEAVYRLRIMKGAKTPQQETVAPTNRVKLAGWFRVH